MTFSVYPTLENHWQISVVYIQNQCRIHWLTVSLLPTDDTDILGMDPIGPLAPLEGQKPLLHCTNNMTLAASLSMKWISRSRWKNTGYNTGSSARELSGRVGDNYLQSSWYCPWKLQCTVGPWDTKMNFMNIIDNWFSLSDLSQHRHFQTCNPTTSIFSRPLHVL
jgi:hypothetical protein